MLEYFSFVLLSPSIEFEFNAFRVGNRHFCNERPTVEGRFVRAFM